MFHPAATRSSAAGRAASTATAWSSSPRRRCSRSSPAAARPASTPSTRSPRSAPRAGAPPAVDPRLRRRAPFAFANPAAIRSLVAEIPGTEGLALAPRIAAIIGAEGPFSAAYTILAEWRDPGRRPSLRIATSHLVSGPVRRNRARRSKPDALHASSYGSTGLERASASSRPPSTGTRRSGLPADRTKLYAGRPRCRLSCVVEAIAPGVTVAVDIDGIGELDAIVARE